MFPGTFVLLFFFFFLPVVFPPRIHSLALLPDFVPLLLAFPYQTLVLTETEGFFFFWRGN